MTQPIIINHMRIQFIILISFFLPINMLKVTPEFETITKNFSTIMDGTTSEPSFTGWCLENSNVQGAMYFTIKSNRIHVENLEGEDI